MLAPWIHEAVEWFCRLWPADWYLAQLYFVYPGLAIILVSLVCGSVGSIVVGNRMAFFSDALAHCAFAGVALGIMLALLSGVPLAEIRQARHFVTIVMVAFGIAIGLAIAFVREQTALSNDTVIGVFFAGAMGLGAMLLKAVSSRGYFNLENFLFGEPGTAVAQDIEFLFWLTILTGVFLVFFYNPMVFASFSPSLARSRQVPTRLSQYLFIALLGVIVNISVHIVGVLLINAMLIVPAATAANRSANMRQFYRRTVLISVLVGLVGYALSLKLAIPDPPRLPLRFGTSGVIVVLAVIVFFLSMLLPSMRRWFGGTTVPALHNGMAPPTISPQGEPVQAPKA